MLYWYFKGKFYLGHLLKWKLWRFLSLYSAGVARWSTFPGREIFSDAPIKGEIETGKVSHATRHFKLVIIDVTTYEVAQYPGNVKKRRAKPWTQSTIQLLREKQLRTPLLIVWYLFHAMRGFLSIFNRRTLCSFIDTCRYNRSHCSHCDWPIELPPLCKNVSKITKSNARPYESVPEELWLLFHNVIISQLELGPPVDWLIEWPPLSKNMFKKSQNQTHVLTKVFPKNHLFRHSGHPTNLSGFKLILSSLWFNTIYLPMEFTSSISVPMVTYKSKLRLTFSPDSGRLCSKCTGLISVYMKALYSYVRSKPRNG